MASANRQSRPTRHGMIGEFFYLEYKNPPGDWWTFAEQITKMVGAREREIVCRYCQ